MPDALLPAQDRLWRHPAEHGAEQAAANLAARRTHGRSWPSMFMSFVAGCCTIGLIWMLADSREPAPIEEVLVQQISTADVAFDGSLSFDDWVDDVSQLNRSSVVALHLADGADQEVAQAVLLRDDGHLITSSQAIADATEITAEFPGGIEPAQLIASDDVSGIAVLKINSPNLNPPTFGDQSQVPVGDRVVALAHRTLDSDVAIAQSVDLVGRDHVAMMSNGHLLTDAFRLNEDLGADWSGSAILSGDGGIVAMAVTARDGGTYAIPINAARAAANQLLSTGTVEQKSYLGVDDSGLSDNLMEERGIPGGVLLTRVWAETPAARAGLVAGDVITRAGSVNVLNRTDLREALATFEPGSTIEITYSRGNSGVEITLEGEDPVEVELLTTVAVLGARPDLG